MLQNDGNKYLTMYPKLRRWIQQCIACQCQGYKPDMPENIYPGVAADNLRRYFQPLALNTQGLCEQCHNAFE